MKIINIMLIAVSSVTLCMGQSSALPTKLTWRRVINQTFIRLIRRYTEQCKVTVQLSGRMFGMMVGIMLMCFVVVLCQGGTGSDRLAALRHVTETVPAPSAASRVAGCVELLKQEMKSPSSASFGPGGGPIDTGYIQEVIMGSVCTFTQKEAERNQIRSILGRKLESTPSSDRALRDRLTIMLGSTGDVSAMPQLINIMEHHSDGFMRYSAVMTLREMSLDALRNSEECVSALKRVIETDTYARIRFGDSHGPMYDSTTMVYSPLRDIAAQMLRRMGLPVPKGVEVVAAKYGVQRVEPLLYDSSNPECIQASIQVLGSIGSIEARTALQTFIHKEAEAAGMKQLVKEAQTTLDRLHLRQ
jgi:hypothetical protein